MSGPSGYLEDDSTDPPTVLRLADDYPHSWTMPYTQNIDLVTSARFRGACMSLRRFSCNGCGDAQGKANAQYPVPGEKPKYAGSKSGQGWSNRGIVRTSTSEIWAVLETKNPIQKGSCCCAGDAARGVQ